MIVVIGGGPAGSAAARFLSMWGHRVHLLTRAPSRVTLAESLPPSCTKLFDQLGVRDAIDHAGFIRATGNTVHWGENAERVEPFGGGALGYQIVRNEFDAILLGQASRVGATVTNGATVHAFSRHPDGWDVAYDSAGGAHTIRAEWLLDCSGRAGVIARDGWRAPRDLARTTALIGVWETAGTWDVPDQTHTLVESYGGGWAWSVPVNPTRRYFTVMVDPSLTEVAGRQDLERMYRAELDRTDRIRGLVASGTLVEPPWARDASPYTAERFGDERTLLVGDAASFIDPLSSYGVKKALASAWLAAIVVNSCARDASLVAPALELFESRERAMFEALQNQTAQLAREAASTHAGDFWRDRAGQDALPAEGEPDVAALRIDPRVLAAFDELKRRDSLQLRLGSRVARAAKATVRGNEIVLVDHIIAPRFPAGVRYVRGIDLVVLSDLATGQSQVGDLFEAYNCAAPPAALPDFLGALSVLVGTDMIEFA